MRSLFTECLKTPDSQSVKERQEPTLQSELELLQANDPKLYSQIQNFFASQRDRDEAAFRGEKTR